MPVNDIPSSSQTREDFVTRVEKKMYFRIARGFAWLCAALCTIILMISAVLSLNTFFDLRGKSTTVSFNELKEAVDRSEKLKDMATPAPQQKVRPKISEEMVRIEKEIDELLEIMEIFPEWRNDVKIGIKQILMRWNTVEEKIAVIKEAKNLIRDFPEEKRIDAINSYFPLKIDKENEANARKAKAQQDIKTYISVLIAMIIALTLISMILVLMAIERNTRREFKN